MAIALVLIGVYNCKKFSFSDEVKTKSYSGLKELLPDECYGIEWQIFIKIK